MKTRLTRRRHFQCLRSLAPEAWSNATCLETAGACLLPQGHGHDYWLEVTLEGEIEAESGMILNLIDVDQTLGRVLAPLDGRRLDDVGAPFGVRPPTTEHLAGYLLDELTRAFAGAAARPVRVRLFESDDLWVDAWP